MTGKGSKFNILIVLAILMATISFVLIFFLINSSKKEAFQEGVARGIEEAKKKGPTVEANASDTVDVLVARQEILPGIIQVTPEMFEVKKFSKNQVPANVYHSIDEVKDLVPAQPIPVGDIVMQGKLKPKVQISRASYLVTPGKRYFSLEINGGKIGEQTVSSMLRVGDIVDILATYETSGVKTSRIILQNLRIIDVVNGDAPLPGAAPQQPQPTGSASEHLRPRLGQGQTITFEGSPQDAEFFKALQSSANVDYTFILRNINDHSVVETDGKRTRDVIAKIIPQEAPPEPTAAPPAPINTRRNY